MACIKPVCVIVLFPPGNDSRVAASFAGGNTVVVKSGVLPGATGAHVAGRTNFGRRIMGKKRLALLYTMLMLCVIAPWGVHAATSYDGDYVRVGVPDMAQAARFFQDVLDCQPIGTVAAATASARESLLLSCDEGSIVELVADHSPSPASEKTTAPLQFVSDDVAHANQWLRQQDVAIDGVAHRMAAGPLAGRMVLDFAAPWGLRLQLVGRQPSDPDSPALATVDARFDGG